MIVATRPYLLALLLTLTASASLGLIGCSKTELGNEKVTPGDPASDREAREGGSAPRK